MKILIVFVGSLILVFNPVSILSQDYKDYLIISADTVKCNVTKIKRNLIFYEKLVNDKVIKGKVWIYNCHDIKIENEDKIPNIQSIQIEEPLKNKIRVYIYRPHNIVNSGVRCRIKCNGMVITALRNNSYCSVDLAPGSYIFSWGIGENMTMTGFTAVEGEIHFVQCYQDGAVYMSNGVGGYTGGLSFSLSTVNKSIGSIGIKQTMYKSVVKE